MAFVWAPPQPRTSTPSTRSYRVQILRGAAELEAFDVALRTLGAAALDDNAYAAPAFMGPLLRHRAGEHPLRIALSSSISFDRRFIRVSENHCRVRLRARIRSW